MPLPFLPTAGPIRMPSPLFVLVVQREHTVGTTLASAIAAAGHEPLLANTPRAVEVVRGAPPDCLVLERSAPGYQCLLAEVDRLEVHVPVLVTSFDDGPPPLGAPDARQAAAVVERVEAAAWRPWGRVAALLSRHQPLRRDPHPGWPFGP